MWINPVAAKTNVFSASIGNLPPGKEVLVGITYVVDLEFDDGKLKFVIPSLPFAPDGKKSPRFEIPANKQGKYSKDVGYGLRIDVSFDMTSNIKSIASPSHPIAFEVRQVNFNAVVWRHTSTSNCKTCQ